MSILSVADHHDELRYGGKASILYFDPVKPGPRQARLRDHGLCPAQEKWPGERQVRASVDDAAPGVPCVVLAGHRDLEGLTHSDRLRYFQADAAGANWRPEP